MNGYDSLYNRYLQEANIYASQYGINPKTEIDGAWDAFRHAYASGAMTQEYSETAAHVFGDLNEIYGDFIRNQSENVKNMDKWNNAVGRDIGKNVTSNNDDIARQVYEAIKRGDLIIDAKNDARRYGGDNPPVEGNSSGDTGGTGSSGGTSGGEDTGAKETTPPRRSPLVPYIGGDAHTDQLSRLPAQNLIPADNSGSPAIQVTPEPEVRQQLYYGDKETQQGEAHHPASAAVHVDQGEPDSSSLVAEEQQQTAVDPLVSGINGDGVLSDPGNSGQLRQSGWVGTGGGFLVQISIRNSFLAHDNNRDGIINDILKMFSPYIYGLHHTPGEDGDEEGNQDNNNNQDDDICDDYSCEDGDYDNDSQNTAVDILHAFWNVLKAWAGISQNAQSQVNGANIGSVDSGEEEELNNLSEAGISQLQPATGDVAPNEPRDSNRLLHGDTVIQHGQDPLLAEGQPADEHEPNSVNDTLHHEPMDSLVDSLTAFTHPAVGQMRFSSDYHHTAMAQVMTARWQ